MAGVLAVAAAGGGVRGADAGWGGLAADAERDDVALRAGGLGVEGPRWAAAFHSVSAFCNAGFSLFSAGLADERIVEDVKEEVDLAVVADADDFAASLLVTGRLQDLGVKRLVCRSLNPTREKILRLMQVDEIVQAEELAARHFGWGRSTRSWRSRRRLGCGGRAWRRAS